MARVSQPGAKSAGRGSHDAVRGTSAPRPREDAESLTDAGSLADAGLTDAALADAALADAALADAALADAALADAGPSAARRSSIDMDSFVQAADEAAALDAAVSSGATDPSGATVSSNATVASEAPAGVGQPPADKSDRLDPAQGVAKSAAIAATRRTLTDRERAMLEFERLWWRHAGAKEQAIRDTFGLSSTHYYRLLNSLLDVPAAAEFDALVVGRLRRLRASRARRRTGRSA
jgi:hypothetical protein